MGMFRSLTFTAVGIIALTSCATTTRAAPATTTVETVAVTTTAAPITTTAPPPPLVTLPATTIPLPTTTTLKNLGLSDAPLSSGLLKGLVESPFFVLPHASDDSVGEVAFV